MGTAERRRLLLEILSRKRQVNIDSLASEFGVSKRTIRRDIEILSLSEPIYTETGRYGGVFVVEGYDVNKFYLSYDEEDLFRKIIRMAECQDVCDLNKNEIEMIKKLISTYTKPKKPV